MSTISGRIECTDRPPCVSMRNSGQVVHPGYSSLILHLDRLEVGVYTINPQQIEKFGTDIFTDEMYILSTVCLSYRWGEPSVTVPTTIFSFSSRVLATRPELS
eukprot:6177456-Pleurochrysis_carterae.AAC.2